MKSVSKWLFLFFVSCVHRGNGVRIFRNIQPTAHPTRNVPFKAEVISKTCKLKPDKGPCRGNLNMYYFDLRKSNCSTFKWGGCQGNGNRFDTFEECQDKCLSKKGAPKRRPKYCMLTYDYGYCFGALERWYFDRVWKTCKKTIYSGCGGNDNNFIHKEQCESLCLYGKGIIQSNLNKARKDAGKKFMIINPGSKDEKSKKGITTDPNKGQDGKAATNGKSGIEGKSGSDGKVGSDGKITNDKTVETETTSGIIIDSKSTVKSS